MSDRIMRKLNLHVPRLKIKMNSRMVATVIGTAIVIAFIGLGIYSITSGRKAHHLQDIQIKTMGSEKQQLQSDVHALEVKFEKLKTDKSATEEQKQQLQQQIQEKDKQLQEKDAQLQAKADAKKAEADRLAAAARLSTGSATAAAAAPSGAIAGCGDNFYANYIYSHESGCRTHNPNGSGCDGIGQACPASKVIDQCGYDYACQNAWFTNYANKYGGWAGAYTFWVNNHWW